jgi:hypothetical protein
MMLSTHFSLAELCASQTADRAGIVNNADDFTIAKLTILCHGLEMIRALVGQPILISSGYRCLELNAAVGSKPTSQHVLGQAADITCPQYGDPKSLMKAIMSAKLPYDQCILEYYQPATWSTPAHGWVHVSFVRGEPRQQALVIDQQGERAYA